jgi:uncharacterized protein
MKTGIFLARRSFLLCMAGVAEAALGQEQRASQAREGSNQPMLSDEDALRAANLDVVRRYCVAWRAGDLSALRDCYHDEFTLHYGGHNPLSGDHVGKAAALATLAKFSRWTQRRLLSIVDVMAGPNRAVVLAREAFERNGQRAELDRVFVYTIKERKLHHCWVYDLDQSTVDRFLAG